MSEQLINKMDATRHTLSFCSYNSTGFGVGTQNFIDNLLVFSDILCLQEHFLQDCNDKKHSNTDILKNRLGSLHDMYIVPAKKDASQVSKGRGKGGLATIWNRSLTKYVKRVHCTNFRLQATLFEIPDCTLLVINTYFPCDPRSEQADITELLELLSDIENVIENNVATNILLTGDLNCHFQRNTGFTSIVLSWLRNTKLALLWNLDDERIEPVDFTFCHLSAGILSSSIIDHFAVNQHMLNGLVSAGVIHDGSNLSPHSPIYAKFDVGNMELKLNEVITQNRISWENASSLAKDNFKEVFNQKLENIQFGHECWDVKCTSIEHQTQLENYTISVLEAMESAGSECLPSTYTKNLQKKEHLAGWNEYVKPFSDESRFWFNVWASAGKPHQGELFAIMKTKKLQYKYAVRRLKRCSDIIKNEKLLESLVNKDRNIFDEIKKLRKKKMGLSSRIDDKVSPDDIATHFSDIYMKLFNNVVNDESFEHVEKLIHDKTDHSSISAIKAIDKVTIRDAIEAMKSDKRDAVFNVTSDMYKNSPEIFYDHLTNIIRQSLVHGRLPQVVLLCMLMPLIKNNLGDATKSDNYRAIAGGCLILKVLDLVILNLEGNKLSTDHLQFAYKANSGTASCTWAVTTVIDHFTRDGMSVFGASMDMSKAFDMVDWKQLFKTLLKRGVNPVYLRLLLYVYTSQKYTVKWGTAVAEFFSISNGVRQGGVSSGIFFAVYIDELIDLLRNSSLGCSIHGVFYGALVYADDIFLLSASRSGLQAMINISQSFTAKLNLKFGTNINPDKSKTKCLVFTKSRKVNTNIKEVSLGDHLLPWVKEVKHLRHTLQQDNSMKIDINLKRGAFIGKTNSLLQEFHYADPQVLLKLIQTYACNIYGSNIWDLFSPECNKLYTSYNVTLRNILNLPRTTHRYVLECLTDMPHLYVQLLSRYITFTKSLQSSSFPIRFLSSLCISDMRTVIGRSLSKISELCDNLQGINFLTANEVKQKIKYARIPSTETWRIGVINDMLDAINSPTTGLSYDEALVVLEHACCS